MAHLFGVYLPAKKKVFIALTKIYGIGINRAQALCNSLNINKNLKTKNLSKLQILKLSSLIKKSFLIKEDLIRLKSLYIKRLLKIKSYRGIRHRKGLPLRGQRTSTNGKTQKRLASKNRKGL